MWGSIPGIPCLLLALVAIAASVGADIINTEVKRKIDVSTNVAKITTIYTATGVPANGGTYQFALPLASLPNLAFLKVTSEKKERQANRVAEQQGFAIYEVKAGGSGAEGQFKLRVYAVYTDVLTPYPREIHQLDEQLVQFSEVLLTPTPYPTGTQTTSVVLFGTRVEEYNGNQPMAVSGNTVTFGPYLDALPLQARDMLRVHYTNHAVFAKAESCLREIEVSSWGNIAVEELYEFVHHGAKLKGGFSRLDYTTHRSNAVPNPSFRGLSAILPNSARDIYYRDRIGNISTSTVVPRGNSIELQIFTRYPIMGGWRTSWYQGYNMPTESALVREAANRFTLQMPFGLPFGTMWVDDYTVKVILPEGAKDVQVSVPFAVQESRDTRFTYLDSAILGGRPVVILKKKNVVSEHNLKFTVTYAFDSRCLLHEPFLLVSFFFAFFALCMLALRLDLRIRDDGGGASSAAAAAAAAAAGGGSKIKDE